MKKLSLILIYLVLVGCDKVNLNFISKVVSQDNFHCYGSSSSREYGDNLNIKRNLSQSFENVDYSMSIKKFNYSKNTTNLGKYYGEIVLANDMSFPICFEDELDIKFAPTCNGSFMNEKLPNSSHRGEFNKFTRKLTYKANYDKDNVTYHRYLHLDCKTVTETIVQ